MPGDNVKIGKGKGSRRHVRGNEESLTRYDSDCDSLPAGVRKKLNELFAGIEKEFENLYAENVALRQRVDTLTERPEGYIQERVDTLTERLEGCSGDKLTAENQDVVDGANKPKRSASQISQKIKSTYKVSTSKIVSSFRNPQPAFSLVRHYSGHRDGVWEVMVSRSGQQVLGTASADHTARIWCIQNGQCLLQYQGHQGSVNSIRFHPDKELALTSSGDHTAHIWGAQVIVPSDTGKKYWRSHSSGEDDVEGSEMEEYTEDNVEQNVEISSLRTPSMEFNGHSGVVVAADWMSVGNQVITASWDRTAILYDTETGEQISSLTGHDQELTDVRSHPSQQLAVTSSKDTTFRLWDFRGPSMLVNVSQGHNQPVTSAVFAGSDKVVSGSDDRTVKVWDLKNMRSPVAAIRVDSSVNRFSVSPTQNLIAIPHDNRHIRIYDVNGNRIGRLPRSNRQGHSKMVCAVAWADDNVICNLFSCGFDRQVLGWSVNLQSKE